MVEESSSSFVENRIWTNLNSILCERKEICSEEKKWLEIFRYKNGVEAKNVETKQIGNNKYQLIIDKATKDDEADYKVRALNEIINLFVLETIIEQINIINVSRTFDFFS